jgi:Ca-activated chloride channel family protein
MLRKFFPKYLTLLMTFAATVLAFVALRSSSHTVIAQTTETRGSLQVLGPDGKPAGLCPLKHTAVKANISGFLARVVVTQEFENPSQEKIEAVYTFPLPQNAAVDDMTMIVGDRTVRGKILRREEAQAVYEAAKSGGQVASLLDQERPNIFTQSVANILPGEQVKITISYVEKLKYEAGSYEFVFPMVVGPRYVPGVASGSQGRGFSADTDRVPDGSRITPQPAPEGMRAGHNVSIEVDLDSGLTIDALTSKSHEIDVERTSVSQARIKLKNDSVIPNKDFILRYDVAGKGIADALLTHRAGRGGFFSLILQPPERVTVEDVSPKELVFVLDTSGSMQGFPIEKAKETMKLALDNLYPADTFNLITFSGDTRILFPEPVPATPENLRKAQRFLAQSSGYGGTEMMKAIKASLDPSDGQNHVRIVCFMTDGYVGNDMEIIAEIRKHPNARVFAFGIGSSVNRFLLDKMAEQGRGEVEYVGLSDDGSAAARRFHERVRNPLLTDISVEWNGLPVADVYPKRVPDLFGAKPVILTGRYTASGRGVLRLKGKMSGQDFVREISVEFPEARLEHDVLASLWARTRIEDLMSQDYAGAQQGAMRQELKQTVTQLGLEYRLMTQFTSFVAVEEMIVTEGGQPRRIDVPIEMPEGVNRASVFGKEEIQVSFGRGRANLFLSGGVSSVQATVSVSSAPAVDTSRTDVTTVIDRRMIEGGSDRSGSAASRSKSKKALPAPPNMAPTVSIAEPSQAVGQLSPEEQRRAEQLRKLNPSLLALIERLKKPEAKPSTEETRFVRDGKAELQIWLTEKSAETMALLKEFGFEVVLDPRTSKLVIGKLALEKLEKLAELKFVRYAAPQMSRN